MSKLIFSNGGVGMKRDPPDLPTMQAKFDEFMRIIQINPVERTVMGEPVTFSDIAKHLDLHSSTISGWNKALHKKGKKPQLPPINGSFVESMKLVEAIDRIDESLKKGALKPKRKGEDEAFSFEIGDERLLKEHPKEWLKQQLPQIFKALVASCVKGNPVATKLVCELVDPEYKQKQEATTFNAGYITRLILEAERETYGRTDGIPDNGNGQVQKGLPLLSQELRLPSGQDSTEDSQI